MIPISALEKFVYCPRQCALVLVDGIWAENVHMTAGKRFHRRVDSAKDSIERGVQILRSVEVWSDELNLIGRTDAVHVTDGQIMPVEHKAGVRHGDAAEVQVCAQTLCLEEMTGQRIEMAAIWYQGHRRRHKIPIDDELRQRTLGVISNVRDIQDALTLPIAPNDERCDECQLLGNCMPGVSSHTLDVQHYMSAVVFAETP